MTTRFSKQKLAEAQEKKAKGGLVNGLLSKKRPKVGDISNNDPVVTPPSIHSLAKHPASPTLSLEVITSTREETKKTKHHPDLDLSSLVIGDVEKELLSDRPSEATVENVMEEATTIVEVTEEVAPITLANPTPDKQ